MFDLRIIKKLLLLSAIVFSDFCKAEIVVSPEIKSKTTFAILVDKESYKNANKEILAYRSAIEKEGLGTYIWVNDQESPIQIRAFLQNLYLKKTPLEGAVFIGDIPIPMLRDAQHLTSAFKMNQKANWQKSSVPSDRYYDDFDLDFRFIKQDSIQPLYYYFSLTEKGKQTLSPAIYSARIKPYEIEGQDKYELLRNYLQKVVREKQNNSQNQLDIITMARGHGYNSDDMGAWAGEQMALKEQFPIAFKAGGCIKFMDFGQRFPMKNYFLNEIQEPNLDVMLFHHHGSPDTQYINGYEEGSAAQLCIFNLKKYIHSKVLAMAEKKTKEEAVDTYSKYLDVPEKWCWESFNDSVQKADSIFDLSLDISTNDIRQITPQARFILHDACYNGSFYKSDYIAGAYLFNKGNVIASQGSTVNTIQDKWVDEMLGLLSLGMRIGEWNRYTCFLETHILGDPTFHFKSNNSYQGDINKLSILHDKDASLWKKMLRVDNPDIQCLALRKLYDLKYPSLNSLMHSLFIETPYSVVRMAILKYCVREDNEDTRAILRLAVSDSYELVRRFSIEYIPKIGDESLIEPFISNYLNRSTDLRSAFKFSTSQEMFDADLLSKELDRQLKGLTFYNNNYVTDLKNQLSKQKKKTTDELLLINDTITANKYKIMQVQTYRNHPSNLAIGALLKCLANDKTDEALRITTAEALGWYTLSCKKSQIIEALKQISKDPNVNADLKIVLQKSLKRLSE